MGSWRQRGSLWCLEPRGERRGLVEFIGGSYLAATPQLSYRRLLESLVAGGWAVRAWSYVPGFDHQSQANQAWKDFRAARSGDTAEQGTAEPMLRLGHSLGCKLHLLAPDGGRNSSALVALSFNNFSAERSVPLLAEMGEQLGFRSEFSPSPEETLRQVRSSYRQPRNLLIRFRADALDQSGRLLAALQHRPDDSSSLLELPGDHLTPASAGLRRQLLGSWADDQGKQRLMHGLVERIGRWLDEEVASGGTSARAPAL
jgi:hypothetical protein